MSILCFLVLQSGLSEEFNNVSVTVVDCPDLTSAPYLLASEGKFIKMNEMIYCISSLVNMKINSLYLC